MLEEQQDATRISSPETEREAEVVQPTTDVQSESSPESVTGSQPESPEAQFNQTIEALESGKSPLQATKKPEAQPAKTDEQAENPKADALSQEQEQALNKNFSERAEWKALLDTAPQEKKAEVRKHMRVLFERENALKTQVEQTKPRLQQFERLRKAAGDDQATENTLRLVELYQQGDPKAREMLTLLLNDFDSRTGAVVTSPDLLKRQKDNQAMLEQGLIDENELALRNKDLLELQKSRVSQQQTQEQRQQAEQEQLRRTVEVQQIELNNACNDWEKDKMASDPDYAALQSLVSDRAFKLANDRQQKLQGRLLNGAEMKQVLDDALQQVKAETGKLIPKPKPRTALTGTSSSATSRRQPANAEEEFFQQIEELESRKR